jgi:MazG family protein
MNESLSNKFLSLVEIMKRLRLECPWDRQQTPESLRKYILEEAYEVVETIDHQDWEELGKELGDLLLQIIFQSVIAQESEYFSIESVIENINNKLIERHPHIFGEKKVNSAREVEVNWEHIKIKNLDKKSLLSGVPKSAPALLSAQRLQEKAARVSFDWDDILDVLNKLNEEIGELQQAIVKKNTKYIEEEIGDTFFSLVNLSRFLNISAEDALRKSNEKFIRRFQYIENSYNHDYEKMKQAGLEALDKKWEEAKKRQSK